MGKKKKKEPMAEVAESAERLVKAGVEFVNTTIKLARDVWEDSKILALRRGISLAKLIEDSLRRELKEEEKRK